MRKKIFSFPAHFLNEIDDFNTIYSLLSGGYHSSTTALLLYDYGFENVSLVHNRTYLESKHALDLIQHIIYKTGYSYNLIEPNLKGKRVGTILKDSLNQVDKILECFIQDKHNYRDFIPCCKILKKQPARKWYTKNIDKKNSVIISSICPYESMNRNRRLTELRNLNTYVRLHNRMGNVFYSYPYRDIYSVRPFHEYLITKNIIPEHSGCVMCPIQIAYDKYQELKRLKTSSFES